MGAAPIDAVDIDPMSVRVARANLDLNDAADKIVMDVGSADWAVAAGKRYDIVVANIIARILMELSADLATLMRPGGLLLLSGIIEPKEEATRQTFGALGLDLIERQSDG